MHFVNRIVFITLSSLPCRRYLHQILYRNPSPSMWQGMHEVLQICIHIWQHMKSTYMYGSQIRPCPFTTGGAYGVALSAVGGVSPSGMRLMVDSGMSYITSIHVLFSFAELFRAYQRQPVLFCMDRLGVARRLWYIPSRKNIISISLV